MHGTAPCRHVSPCAISHSSSGRSPFARPFRFGAGHVNARRRLFVRAEIEVEGKGKSVGASAEMMVPKWFDKRAHLSPDADRRRNCAARWRSRASFIWRGPASTPRSALHAACIAAQVEACAKEDIPPLAAAFGPAEIDKAILDALLRGARRRISSTAWPQNIAGIDARLSPDLGDDEIAQFLSRPRAAGARRDPAHRRPRRPGRRRGRRRRYQRKRRRALFQAQAQRRSRRRCGAPDPDRQGTGHVAARLQRHAGRQRAICRSRSARARWSTGSTTTPR